MRLNWYMVAAIGVAPDEDAVNSKTAAVVWPWREQKAVLAAPPQRRIPLGAILRQAGSMAVAGAVLRWGLERPAMALVAWALAAVVAASGCFAPPLFAAMGRWGQALGRWGGALLTWGLLAPFYYAAFVPLHLLQRMAGKDPLQRRFPSPAPTYWVPREPGGDAARYRKQFR